MDKKINITIKPITLLSAIGALSGNFENIATKSRLELRTLAYLHLEKSDLDEIEAEIEVAEMLNQIELNQNPPSKEQGMKEIMYHIDEIRKVAKLIGVEVVFVINDK
jgi:hypothetical protein